MGKYEEEDEKNYVKRQKKLEDERGSRTAVTLGRKNTQLIKLQRKLIQNKPINVDKSQDKIIFGAAFPYNFGEFKTKLDRRASFSTLNPSSISISKPECQPIEITLIEPYTLYKLYIFMLFSYLYGAKTNKNRNYLDIEQLVTMESSLRLFVYKWNLIKYRHSKRKFNKDIATRIISIYIYIYLYIYIFIV